jgi:hypothetical protein
MFFGRFVFTARLCVQAAADEVAASAVMNDTKSFAFLFLPGVVRVSSDFSSPLSAATGITLKADLSLS